MQVESVGTSLVMASLGGNNYRDQKTSFWKKNTKNVPGSIKPVYGAQHPPMVEKPTGSHPSTPKKTGVVRSRDSFQDFQDKTDDAWDDGDDDLILSASVKMSMRDVHTTAMQVINNHSQQMAQAAANPVNGADSDYWERSASGPNSPAHSSHGGPGVGVRQSMPWKPPKSSLHMMGRAPVPDREAIKADKFETLLKKPNLELDEVRKLSWSGVPQQFRPAAWKILAGYVPPSLDRRGLTLQRKRKEYLNFVAQYYDTRLQEIHADTFRQISIDIPRMSPLIPLFQQKVVQEIFERILYIWAIRHPASGYVQGINDLVTPFFIVFLSEFLPAGQEIDHFEVGSLDKATLDEIEADSFWCFSKLLDAIQDNYTFAQPGIQGKVNALKHIISRIDHDLHTHLEGQHVEYLQFSFRWMNNLLMREFPLRCTIRLWDSYLAEADDFASLHLYVCAALLSKFSSDLQREKDFQGLMLMLQNLPTQGWNNEEISLLLAEAYRLKYMFADAPNHLLTKT